MPFAVNPLVEYTLRNKDPVGAVDWLRCVPDSNSTINATQGNTSIRMTIPKAYWSAISAGDITPYFSFQVSYKVAAGQVNNAGGTAGTIPIVIEPYAVFQQVNCFVNQVQVNANQTNRWTSIYCAWLARKSASWMRTHGRQLGVQAVDSGMYDMLPMAPHTIAGNGSDTDIPKVDADVVTRTYIVPLPEDLAFPFCSTRGAFPLKYMSSLYLDILTAPSANWLYYGVTAAAPGGNAGGTNVTLQNLELWIPVVSMHPSVDAKMQAQLEAAVISPERSLVMELSDCSVQALTVPALAANATSSSQTSIVTDLKYCFAIECLMRPTTIMSSYAGYKNFCSVKNFVTQLQLYLNSTPASLYPISTTGIMNRLYSNFLDSVQAMNKETKGVCSDTYLLPEAFNQDSVPAYTAVQQVSWWSFISPRTAPNPLNSEIASYDALKTVNVQLTQAAGAGGAPQAEWLYLLHHKARQQFSASFAAVER